MNRYKYIFIVLVYKNIDVLRDFFESLHVEDSKVVVVNSFYDNDSLEDCRKVAETNNADFIPVENKGYGYGNNVGIQFAIDNYTFDYLIVSNSDIIIKNISYLDKINLGKAIIAPDTRLLSGKRQNPNVPWKLPFIFDVTKYALKYNLSWLYLLTHIYTRSSRELFLIYSFFIRKPLYKIFGVHGSFFVMTEQAVKELNPLFHNEMFLYNEEWYLAMKAKFAHIPVYYSPVLKVLHLEGGSTVHFDNSPFKYNQQSYTIFFDWLKSNKQCTEQ